LQIFAWAQKYALALLSICIVFCCFIVALVDCKRQISPSPPLFQHTPRHPFRKPYSRVMRLTAFRTIGKNNSNKNENKQTGRSRDWDRGTYVVCFANVCVSLSVCVCVCVCVCVWVCKSIFLAAQIELYFLRFAFFRWYTQSEITTTNKTMPNQQTNITRTLSKWNSSLESFSLQLLATYTLLHKTKNTLL